MDQTLSDKSFKAVVWNLFGQFSSQIVSLGIGLILVRLLSPQEYGLVAMSIIFNGISNVFIDGGFSSALIRKTDHTQKDLSTVFFFNNGMAVIMYVIVFLFAPMVANFFRHEELTVLIRVLSVNFMISSLGTIQGILLVKKLDYKTQSIIRLISVIISGGISVFMAFSGYGIWALVAQILLQSIIWVIGMWLTSKWRPILVFSRKSFKDLFAFGSKLMASSFLYEIFAQSYPVIIGKFFSASQVGFYNRAESYQKITSYTISSMVNSVTFPALSLIQNDDQRLREAYRRIIKMTMLITVPLMAGLILIARPLIITLITAKWIQVVPYLQWMCVVGMFQPINVINLNIVNVKGRSDLYLYLIIANKVLIVLSIFVGYFWGIIGILIGQVFTAVISYAMSAYLADRFIKYSVFQQAKDIAPYFLLSTGMCIIGYLSGHYIDNLVVKMLLQIAVCMGFYYAMARVLKLTALDELISLITNFIRRKPSERKE